MGMRWLGMVGWLLAAGCTGDSITDNTDAAPLGPCGLAEPVWEQPLATLDGFHVIEQAAQVIAEDNQVSFLIDGPGSARIESIDDYQLPSSQLSVRVDPPDSTVGSRGYMGLVEQVEQDPQIMEMAMSDERLLVESSIDGVSHVDVNVPLDVSAHRYWRVNADARQARFEVSADGDVWNQLYSYALADTRLYMLRFGMIGFPGSLQETGFGDARWCGN